MSKEEGDFWRNVERIKKEKRWDNHEKSREILIKNNIDFVEKPNSQFIIGDWHFWATTGKIYNIKTKEKSRGVFNLLKKLKND